MEPWVKEYLKNPDFIDYTDYYVKRATDNSLSNELVSAELRSKTDQEISELIYLDEYFSERFHSRRRGDSGSEVAKTIYAFIKRAYTNPLSLKELCRIGVRAGMVREDFKMKFRIEKELHIPRRLKEYLMFKEFNL